MKSWLILVFTILTVFFVGFPAFYKGQDAFIFVKNVTYDSIVFFAAFAFFWTCRTWLTVAVAVLLWLNLSSNFIFITDNNLHQSMILLSTLAGITLIIIKKYKGVENAV